MKRGVFREPALQAQFEQVGFVAVPMLSPNQIKSLLAEISRLDPADSWHPDGSGPAMNSYHCSFLDKDKRYKRAAFELLSGAFAQVIDQYLEDFRPLSANFYVKPVGQGRIPVHQNWPVLDSLSATSVTVWCPLVDVDRTNGGLCVLPRSQKLLPHVEGPGSLSYFSAFRDDLDDILEPLSAKAGDGFIFDDSIIHGSPENHGNGPRLAVQITCIPQEAAPVFYFRRDDEQFEMIDADRDFYVDHDVEDLVERRPEWPQGRLVANQNVQIDKDQLRSLLRKRASAAIGEGWAARIFRRFLGH